MAITIDDLTDLVRLLEEHPDWQEALARILLSERTVQRVLQANPELRASLRRMFLDEEFLQLPAIVRELVEVSRQAMERLERLEAINQRLEQGVEDLRQWRYGEDGRRRGEQYERKILRQIGRLMAGGTGGSPDQEEVRRRLTSWLARLVDDAVDDENDPSLADIIWWKGDRVAVIEVSLKVNGLDVLRARQRAETLRRAGVNAMPVVIGEEWAHPESRQLAQQEGVEWMVAKEISPGLIEFRRIPPPVESE